ncbi:MAG TPA: hypothetical protein VMT89_03690, partial [Candidatus Acidoferrales bacterium]|nr:hypothetical protein [Candidatus Acidoferrales bacterium]
MQTSRGTLWCVIGFSFALAAPTLAHAACNLIPQTDKTFESVRGSTNRPYAGPGEPIDVRLRA